MINSPSLFNCDLTCLHEQLDEMTAGGAKYMHIDLIDGHYAGNLGFPPRIISDIKKRYPDLVADVHIMVTNPADYVDVLKKAGADYVCFHTDSTRFVLRTLKAYRDAGIKPGVVLNPSQDIRHLIPFIDQVDMVIVMAVEPGFAGQSYLPRTTERIRELAALRKERDLHFLINVDGGVNDTVGHELEKLGVDIIVGTIHNIFNQPVGLREACEHFEAEFNKKQP